MTVVEAGIGGKHQNGAAVEGPRGSCCSCRSASQAAFVHLFLEHYRPDMVSKVNFFVPSDTGTAKCFSRGVASGRFAGRMPAAVPLLEGRSGRT